MKKTSLTSLMHLVVSIFFITSLASAAEYTIGVVPQFDSKKTFSIWSPIAKELLKQTGNTYKIVPSKNIPAFETEFSAGKFDFAYMNPFHMLLANRDQGYVPVVRDNGRSLKGILVVKKNDPIKNVKGLEGKKVAFPSPNALGASLLMRTELKKIHGVNITPVYVKTHNAVYFNVNYSLASAGGGVGRTFNAQQPAVKDNLRILYTTQKVSPHPFAVHPRVPKNDAAKVKQALLAMGQQEKQNAMLKKIPMKKIGSASMTDYEPLNKLGLMEFYVKK